MDWCHHLPPETLQVLRKNIHNHFIQNYSADLSSGLHQMVSNAGCCWGIRLEGVCSLWKITFVNEAQNAFSLDPLCPPMTPMTFSMRIIRTAEQTGCLFSLAITHSGPNLQPTKCSAFHAPGFLWPVSLILVHIFPDPILILFYSVSITHIPLWNEV